MMSKEFTPPYQYVFIENDLTSGFSKCKCLLQREKYVIKRILKKARGFILPPLLLMEFTEGATFHFTLKPAQALV